MESQCQLPRFLHGIFNCTLHDQRYHSDWLHHCLSIALWSGTRILEMVPTLSPQHYAKPNQQQQGWKWYWHWQWKQKPQQLYQATTATHTVSAQELLKQSGASRRMLSSCHVHRSVGAVLIHCHQHKPQGVAVSGPGSWNTTSTCAWTVVVAVAVVAVAVAVAVAMKVVRCQSCCFASLVCPMPAQLPVNSTCGCKRGIRLWSQEPLWLVLQALTRGYPGRSRNTSWKKKCTATVVVTGK